MPVPLKIRPLVAPFPAESIATEKQVLIGWAERVVLSLQVPSGLKGHFKLRAKIDTGARTSSLHATNFELFDRDERAWLRFRLPLIPTAVEVEAPLVKMAPVKTSHGRSMRYFVEASLRVGPVRTQLVLSLTDRSHLTYPILLGRSFLCDKFIVDSGRKFLHARRKPR